MLVEHNFWNGSHLEKLSASLVGMPRWQDINTNILNNDVNNVSMVSVQLIGKVNYKWNLK